MSPVFLLILRSIFGLFFISFGAVGVLSIYPLWGYAFYYMTLFGFYYTAAAHVITIIAWFKPTFTASANLALQEAIALNGLILVLYWGLLFLPKFLNGYRPTTDDLIRDLCVHLVPWVSTQLIVYTSDITMIEMDWRYCFIRSLLYIPCNIAGFFY